MRYRCTHGHDRCGQMYAGPECQYCEIRPVPLFASTGDERREAIEECAKVIDEYAEGLVPDLAWVVILVAEKVRSLLHAAPDGGGE